MLTISSVLGLPLFVYIIHVKYIVPVVSEELCLINCVMNRFYPGSTDCAASSQALKMNCFDFFVDLCDTHLTVT